MTTFDEIMSGLLIVAIVAVILGSEQSVKAVKTAGDTLAGLTKVVLQ
jgi:Sec-independent protein translocase protein TatA